MRGKGGIWREAGGRQQSLCFLAAELQHAPKLTSPVPKSHHGELDIPRDPAGRRRQALPKATLILSRKSPTFILMKAERSPPSGKQSQSEIPLRQHGSRVVGGGKNSVKIVTKWYYDSFCLQLGPGGDAVGAHTGAGFSVLGTRERKSGRFLQKTHPAMSVW